MAGYGGIFTINRLMSISTDNGFKCKINDKVK